MGIVVGVKGCSAHSEFTCIREESAQILLLDLKGAKPNSLNRLPWYLWT
jgi:hypothetical protein